MASQTIAIDMLIIQSWWHGFGIPYHWIVPRMCVFVHAWRLMAFSWSFVVLLRNSPLGDNGRPCVRTCACTWGEHTCGHCRACRSSLGKKFYEPRSRFIKYRSAAPTGRRTLEQKNNNNNIKTPLESMRRIVCLFFLSCFSMLCSRTPPASRALLASPSTVGV